MASVVETCALLACFLGVAEFAPVSFVIEGGLVGGIKKNYFFGINSELTIA